MTSEKKDQLKTIQDFFSKRAIAFASFFMASFFALFTTLKLIHDLVASLVARVILSITFWTVWIMGAYCLLCFSYYALFAHQAQWEISHLSTDRIFEDFRAGHRFALLRFFYDYKYGFGLAKHKTIEKVKDYMTYIFGTIYFLISLLSWIVVCFGL